MSSFLERVTLHSLFGLRPLGCTSRMSRGSAWLRRDLPPIMKFHFVIPALQCTHPRIPFLVNARIWLFNTPSTRFRLRTDPDLRVLYTWMFDVSLAWFCLRVDLDLRVFNARRFNDSSLARFCSLGLMFLPSHTLRFSVRTSETPTPNLVL
jgi:hypothetical protein